MRIRNELGFSLLELMITVGISGAVYLSTNFLFQSLSEAENRIHQTEDVREGTQKISQILFNRTACTKTFYFINSAAHISQASTEEGLDVPTIYDRNLLHFVDSDPGLQNNKKVNVTFDSFKLRNLIVDSRKGELVVKSKVKLSANSEISKTDIIPLQFLFYGNTVSECSSGLTEIVQDAWTDIVFNPQTIGEFKTWENPAINTPSPRYVKNKKGFVHFSGCIWYYVPGPNLAALPNTIPPYHMFTLPVAYRPGPDGALFNGNTFIVERYNADTDFFDIAPQNGVADSGRQGEVIPYGFKDPNITAQTDTGRWMIRVKANGEVWAYSKESLANRATCLDGLQYSTFQ